MTTFAVTLRGIIGAALAVAVASCAPETKGYYRTQAEADCLARGLGPESAAFAHCIKSLEEAEYRRWSRGAPGG